MAEDRLKIQQELISLLLKNKDLVGDWLENGPKIEFFDDSHHLLLHAIQHSFSEDVLLTRKSFAFYLESHIKSKLEIGGHEALFNKINLLIIKRDDFPVLRNQIIEFYIAKKSVEQVETYSKNIRKGESAIFAAKKLHENLGSLVDDASNPENIFYEPIKTYSVEMFEALKKIRASPELAKKKILSGIDEIDTTAGVGLGPSQIFLTCRDTGHYKTTLLVNIRFNVFKGGNGVLYLPLEMTKDFYYYKLLSRVAKVNFDKIINPSTLTNEELVLLEKATEYIKKNDAQFYIMESPSRLTTSRLLKEIEKHVDIFQPSVLFIDYLTILAPEKQSNSARNDLQISEMLKILISASKPGSICKDGFCVFSGAQIGRDALKRNQRLTGDKINFGSSDIRSAHDLSTDAANIYIQAKNAAQPNSKIDFWCIKSRYGKTTFKNGMQKSTLNVQPEISLIESISDGWLASSKDDILKKVEDNNLDFDLKEKEEDLEDLLFKGKDKKVDKKKLDEFDMLELDN